MTLLLPCCAFLAGLVAQIKCSTFRSHGGKSDPVSNGGGASLLRSALPVCSSALGAVTKTTNRRSNRYISLTLTMQGHCMEELAWRSSAAVASKRYFKSILNSKNQSDPSIPLTSYFR